MKVDGADFDISKENNSSSYRLDAAKGADVPKSGRSSGQVAGAVITVLFLISIALLIVRRTVYLLICCLLQKFCMIHGIEYCILISGTVSILANRCFSTIFFFIEICFEVDCCAPWTLLLCNLITYVVVILFYSICFVKIT